MSSSDSREAGRSATLPAIEYFQQVATVLQERHREPTKPRRQVRHEIHDLLDVLALEENGGGSRRSSERSGMGLDHRGLDGILFPTLMRHVREDVIEVEMVLVLARKPVWLRAAPGGALRLGMIEPQTVDKKVNRLPQVVAVSSGNPTIERDSRVDAVAVGRRDSGTGFEEIELLVDDPLKALRAGLDAEEDTRAACSGHQSQQLIVHAVSSRAAAPRELLSARDDGLTEGHDLFAVDRVMSCTRLK